MRSVSVPSIVSPSSQIVLAVGNLAIPRKLRNPFQLSGHENRANRLLLYFHITSKKYAYCLRDRVQARSSSTSSTQTFKTINWSLLRHTHIANECTRSVGRHQPEVCRRNQTVSTENVKNAWLSKFEKGTRCHGDRCFLGTVFMLVVFADLTTTA